jgi:formamidopyrimidine-DNA glycosylase
MPELPEVETIRRDLAAQIIGQKITKVIVYDRRVIRQRSLNDFRSRLLQKEFAAVQRRGKALLLVLDAGASYLVIQPMMTGQLIYSKKDLRTPATKVSFCLSNHHYLHYNDSRTFGRLQVVPKLEALKYFRVLGPEPLDAEFNKETLAASLRGRAAPIKALLMDHSFVAGIGNIYASEILFCSGIDPRRPAREIVQGEIYSLHRAIRRVLRAAIKERGTTMNSYRDGTGREGRYLRQLKVYGRAGAGCLTCGAQIVRIILRGRSTYYCSKCQK